jgi:hypothetical protein
VRNSPTKPTKQEIARMKVLADMGESNKSIARKLKRSHHTVKKYLQSREHLEDPETKELIRFVKDKAMSELSEIWSLASSRIRQLLKGGNSKMIETIAAMDRSFQQLRLLQNESTENISHLHLSARIDQQIKKLEAELARFNAETEEGSSDALEPGCDPFR